MIMNPNYLGGGSLLVLSVLLLAACASRPYQGTEVNSSVFLERAISQQNNALIVHAAVPDAHETITLTGLDLYEQGIQPVWLKVENTGSSRARLAVWSIDRNYFSSIEVAYMNRRKFSSEGYEQMQRWFYDNGMPRHIPAGETRSGLVFTHLKRGTKGFNLDIFSDQTAYSYTFFVPIPGFTADFTEVDFQGLYPGEEIRDLSTAELRTVLEEELACCATNPNGELMGAPMNAVIVATGLTLRRSMLRGDWQETAAGDAAGSLIAEQARKQSYRGRPPDAIFTQSREDGNEKVFLQLWLAPWRVDSEPVWVGQVFYWDREHPVLEKLIHSELGSELNIQSFLARESVTADLDSAQSFLFQDFWYNGSLRKIGFVTGVGKASREEPRISFGGTAYFTKGLRVVVFLSEFPMALDEGEIIYRFGSLQAEGEARIDGGASR